MSMHSREELVYMNEFDSYDHAELADKVLWPLVNFKWGDNWREYSFLGNELALAQRGTISGELIDVALKAYTELDLDCGEAKDTSFAPLIDSVELVIARHVFDERKDMMLEAAAGESEYEEGEYDEDDADEDYETGVDGFEDSFQDPELVEAKIISSYLIDVDNDLCVNTSQELADLNTDIKWTFETEDYTLEKDTEDTTEEEAEVLMSRPRPSLLHESDMELMESGLIVFKAPRVIMQAFEKIKANRIMNAQ